MRIYSNHHQRARAPVLATRRMVPRPRAPLVRRVGPVHVRDAQHRRALRVGMPQAQALATPVPQVVASCFDVDTGMIVGGYLDGRVPLPPSVSLYTDGAGMQRARIDVGGDEEADLPVCAGASADGGLELPPGDDCSPVGCETFASPAQLVGPDGCDIGYNGCGDTIGVSVTVPASATVDINVPAAIEFTPRYFIYTSTVAAFTINRVFVANGPNSNFGAGFLADYYRFSNFTSKRVSWPTFYNSPPLTITVTNLIGADRTFAGLLIGIASHQ